MEQTNASEEIIIQEIAMEVESEFQLGGLSDGLYFTFAAEVAKRYALLAVSKDRERTVDIVKSTEDKYHSKDKKTGEEQYSRGRYCEKHSLEIVDNNPKE